MRVTSRGVSINPFTRSQVNTVPIVHYPEVVFKEHPHKSQFLDLTGRVFGRLQVLGYAGSARFTSHWYCICECGNLTRTDRKCLNSGTARSCGCLALELRKTRNATHGLTRVGQRAPEYDIWRKMRSRCENPQSRLYQGYGGRGIKVCERWSDSFAAFLADMGPRPSLDHSVDRINNDGNYEPSNCRWATRSEQQCNTRQNVRLYFMGRTQCLAEWVRELGLNRRTVESRLRKGWSVEQALTS